MNIDGRKNDKMQQARQSIDTEDLTEYSYRAKCSECNWLGDCRNEEYLARDDARVHNSARHNDQVGANYDKHVGRCR